MAQVKVQCSMCYGNGKVIESVGGVTHGGTCPRCGGSGYIYPDTSTKSAGTGIIYIGIALFCLYVGFAISGIWILLGIGAAIIFGYRALEQF